jgi:hypothetical protein
MEASMLPLVGIDPKVLDDIAPDDRTWFRLFDQRDRRHDESATN